MSLAADAHAVVSAAGQLGFRPLSELCRRLEEACSRDAGSPELEARVRLARAQAVRAIDEERETLRAA